MAYVNVADWKPDQVTDWLKGLDGVSPAYIQSFLNNHISGQQLLSFRPDDLEHLGILKIGHQEIILEGVEHLRNIHYELDRENLQLLAMRISCLAHSLHNELCHSHADTQRLSTQILADIANIVTAVKPLIAWLDRPGFSGEREYKVTRSEFLSLALRMATCGQRDRFAETPVTDMKDASAKLAKLADSIIQDMTDPLILQPASLDLATIKKRSSDDLGFYIVPSFRGIHQISDLKLNSAAHQSGKIEPGDEIIQINYQTVVGWDVKHVMALFAESPTEILLTLKKRPRHTKVYGQIYVKPYRLPSKKRPTHSHPFARRPELLTHLPLRFSFQKVAVVSSKKTENPRDSRGSTSSDEEVTVQHNLVVPSKPVHRRATITGASPLSKRPPLDIHELWSDLKLEKDSATKHSSTSVIDFEERVSSAISKSTLSLQACETMKDAESEPVKTETLTIKQRIELFSRDEKQEKPKVPMRVVKPQIRINSEPIMDDTAISEAIKMTSDLSDVPEIEKTPTKPDHKEDAPSIAEVALVQTATPEPQEENKEAPEVPAPKEEHGKVVETINQLFDKLDDHEDSEAIRIGKMLESLSNSLPHSARFRKGIVIGESHGPLSTHSLPHRKGQGSQNREFDSELSRTISRVYKEEPMPKKEVFKYEGLKNEHQVITVSSQKIPSVESLSRTQESYSDYGTYREVGQSQTKTSPRDNLSETSSCRSYSSSDYAEQNLVARHFDLSKKVPQERQTLPKAAPRLGIEHQRQASGDAGKTTPPVPPPRPSLSKPPGACYRAIMAARSIGRGSPKATRKKNNPVLSKGRNVSVKEFSPLDCEGWLLQRCRKGSGMWKKRWCLVHSNTLYTFIHKQAVKAETMVYLPGFTVSPAEEVKSRPFAFKVYHTGTTFYFAAETHFELSVWLDAITTSTLAQNSHSQGITFSESEGEDSKEDPAPQGGGRKPPMPPTPAPRPPPTVPTPQPPPPSESSKKFGSLKKLGCRSGGNSSSGGNTSGSSLDRKYLRLLGTGPVPVPTAQYRSYRRVHNTPPQPSNSSSGTGGGSGEHPQQNLPPEMADYRLASLTAKSTPPVPRRRLLVGLGSRSNETPPGRPHISAPIINPHLLAEDRTPDGRCRRPVPPNVLNSNRDYRDGSPEMFWVDSLRRPEMSKKKSKKLSNQQAQLQQGNQIGPGHPNQMGALHPYHMQEMELNIASPDYPGLEYPPVFEPGTYTLDTTAVLPRLNRHRPA